MARTVGIGIQSLQTIRERQCFYVDKTKFIKEWWESQDEVTLITRPRRSGAFDLGRWGIQKIAGDVPGYKPVVCQCKGKYV